MSPLLAVTGPLQTQICPEVTDFSSPSENETGDNSYPAGTGGAVEGTDVVCSEVGVFDAGAFEILVETLTVVIQRSSNGPIIATMMAASTAPTQPLRVL